jgi:hypothetical protein
VAEARIKRHNEQAKGGQDTTTSPHARERAAWWIEIITLEQVTGER